MAGSWTVGKSKITDKNNVETGRVVVCTFTADAAAATVPDLVIAEATGSYTTEFKWVKGWYLRAIETDPGSTAPTALYDITITNSRAFDIAGAAVTNRSATLTQTVIPKDSDGVAYSPCWDDSSGYTVAVANNAVNSATAAIRLFFAQEPMLGGSANANIQVGDADVSATNPVPVYTLDDVFEATLSLDTNAYADGDLLADTQSLNASAFPANGGKCTVNAIRVYDLDDNKGALDIVLLRSNTSLGTENAAPSISDANSTEIIDVYPIYATDYKDMGGMSIATMDVNRVIKAASDNTGLWIGAISRDTKTYTASGIKVRVGVINRCA